MPNDDTCPHCGSKLANRSFAPVLLRDSHACATPTRSPVVERRDHESDNDELDLFDTLAFAYV